MHVRGIDGLTSAQLEKQLAAGGRLVFYEYCISFGIITLRRTTPVTYLRPGEYGLMRGLPYTLLSLLLGWWGIPWGLIYTPLAIVTNLAGGCDVTAAVRPRLQELESLKLPDQK